MSDEIIYSNLESKQDVLMCRCCTESGEFIAEQESCGGGNYSNPETGSPVTFFEFCVLSGGNTNYGRNICGYTNPG